MLVSRVYKSYTVGKCLWTEVSATDPPRPRAARKMAPCGGSSGLRVEFVLHPGVSAHRIPRVEAMSGRTASGTVGLGVAAPSRPSASAGVLTVLHSRITLINEPDTVNVKLLETLPARLTAVHTYSPLSDTDRFVKLNLDADTICTAVHACNYNNYFTHRIYTGVN